MKNPVPGTFPFTFYVIRHYSSFLAVAVMSTVTKSDLGRKDLLYVVESVIDGSPSRNSRQELDTETKEKCASGSSSRLLLRPFIV